MSSRKENITNAAAQHFRKKGYAATTMTEIADSVGIKAASIYNHFSSKQEILNLLLQHIADQFVQGLKHIDDSSLNAKEKIDALISLHVKMAVEKTDTVALIVSEWVHLEESSKQTYLKKRDLYEKTFRKILERGKSNGLLKKLDTEIMLFSLLSTLRWLYSWYSRHLNYNPVELENQLRRCLLEGIVH